MYNNQSSKENHSIVQEDGSLILTSPSPLIDKLRGCVSLSDFSAHTRRFFITTVLPNDNIYHRLHTIRHTL